MPIKDNDVLKLKVKRGIDIAGGIVGLLLSAPILAAAAIAIKLDDGGTVFFRQWRSGGAGACS